MKKRILIKCGYYGFSNHFDHNTINIHNLNFGIMKVLDVTHISSRGSSFRITLPKKIIKKMDLKEDDIIMFVEKDGEVVLRKMKMEEKCASLQMSP